MRIEEDARIMVSTGDSTGQEGRLLWTGGKGKPRQHSDLWYRTVISTDEIEEEDYGVLYDHDGRV